MGPAISIEVLPADRGDSLWIECRGAGRPWRLLFDGGMPETWTQLRDRIGTLDPHHRIIDLAVVSHIDADHMGGMLPFLSDTDLGVSFGDIWFNGLPQLPEPATGQERY
jgi:metal-dependent hydrolase (beta-lactamase superfamily II)